MKTLPLSGKIITTIVATSTVIATPIVVNQTGLLKTNNQQEKAIISNNQTKKAAQNDMTDLKVKIADITDVTEQVSSSSSTYQTTTEPVLEKEESYPEVKPEPTPEDKNQIVDGTSADQMAVTPNPEKETSPKPEIKEPEPSKEKEVVPNFPPIKDWTSEDKVIVPQFTPTPEVSEEKTKPEDSKQEIEEPKENDKNITEKEEVKEPEENENVTEKKEPIEDTTEPEETPKVEEKEESTDSETKKEAVEEPKPEIKPEPTPEDKNQIVDGTTADQMAVTPNPEKEPSPKPEIKEPEPSKEKEVVPKFPPIKDWTSEDKVIVPQFTPTPEVSEEKTKPEDSKQEIEESKENENVPESKEPIEDSKEPEENENVTEKKESTDSETKKEVVEEEKQQETKPEQPTLPEFSNNKEEQSESHTQLPTLPEVVEDDQELTSPEVNEPVQTPAPQTSSPKVEEPSQEELIALINAAVKKTQESRSVYFSVVRKGIYPGNYYIKYNKDQNRRYYKDKDNGIEEYQEGYSDRYVEGLKIPSRYYYQNRWSRKNESSAWEEQPALYSTFGLSDLTFLKNITKVTKIKNTYFDTYEVTIPQETANLQAENNLNTPNMFKSDITIDISVNRDNYIVLFLANWKKDVLNDDKPETFIELHLGDFNATNVSRPKDLDVKLHDYQPRDTFTETKKLEIKNQITKAYQNTIAANSLTFEQYGEKVMYDKAHNTALYENSNSYTYYKGTDNMYLDYDFVTPAYRQENWTKDKTTNLWTKNITKHKTFTPQELYFLNNIFTVNSEEHNNDLHTYNITILKYDANLAYSHVYDIKDKFTDNVTMTVTIDDNGYIRELKSDFGVNIKIYNVENTIVNQPEDLIISE